MKVDRVLRRIERAVHSVLLSELQREPPHAVPIVKIHPASRGELHATITLQPMGYVLLDEPDDPVTIEPYDDDDFRVYVAGVYAGRFAQHPVSHSTMLIERLTGGMVQGRANASQALEDAAAELSRCARIIESDGLNGHAFRAHQAAQAARTAAVEVRKEIYRP